MTLALLEARALSVAAGATVRFDSWNFTAAPGESVALTGPSGSGKTTLLHCLAGLTPSIRGSVTFAGRPVTLWRDVDCGIVLQNLSLVPILNVRETVGLPLRAAGVKLSGQVERSLEAVGLGGQAGQLVSQLSGGQRQRLAVARALAGSHAVILADEPTSALDEHWREVVLALLVGEARRGAAVVIATGDPGVARRCDREVRLAGA